MNAVVCRSHVATDCARRDGAAAVKWHAAASPARPCWTKRSSPRAMAEAQRTGRSPIEF